MYKEIESCRICGNSNLETIIDLGEQELTGVFPSSKNEKITSGPIILVKCHNGDDKSNACGLVQLKHSYDSDEMYGENYGYRSGLNNSMINHLHGVVEQVLNIVKFQKDDIVIDIGGNDSTMLKAYPKELNLKLTVIDPTGNKFKKYYAPHINLIPDFFTAKTYFNNFTRKAKVVTSIAMFYDLEKPQNFVKDIYDILEDEGIWLFEQSYLPLMLKTNSYDTICHEHLEYYSLKQILWMFDEVGFKLIDVELNDSNGGSFRVIAAKKESTLIPNQENINNILKLEEDEGYSGLEVYKNFKNRVLKHREELVQTIKSLLDDGKTIYGYGASTKGNVLLQYCGITSNEITAIAEINEDKFGKFTPKTLIPIISEDEAISQKPDYYFVLPWHFKKGIVNREREFIENGGKLIFPLPEIQIISTESEH